MTILELDGVSKRYGRRPAVRWIFLAVHAGEVVGLVGPNGAGKTTLLRLSAGLLPPSSGHVYVRVARHEIQYFGGEHTLPGNVEVRRWRSLWHRSQVPPAPRGCIGQMSRGSRQRLGLETALHSEKTRLVLLDEPWEGLDLDAARWLNATLAELRAAGAAILVSSHRIHDLAVVCDRCEFLVGGAIGRSPVRWTPDVGHDDRIDQLLCGYDQARRLQ